VDFWVANTDRRWFDYLRDAGCDEVNFWSPSGGARVSQMSIGTPWLFRLKKPDYALAGFGYFVHFENLPLWLAWERFGVANGFASLEELERQLRLLRRDGSTRAEGLDLETWVGCTTLVGVRFLDESEWLAPVPGFAHNIVVGKGYRRDSPEGQAIATWFARHEAPEVLAEAPPGPPAEGYREVLSRARLGQPGFQAALRAAYSGRCAITGESTAIALEAAHIVPYSRVQSHDVSNGLLLRADFHRLFDAGLIGVSTELEVRVSRRIAEEYANGKLYSSYHGKRLKVVPPEELRPDPERLEWHLRNVFRP
jgi:putative restriction endonuclease